MKLDVEDQTVLKKKEVKSLKNDKVEEKAAKKKKKEEKEMKKKRKSETNCDLEEKPKEKRKKKLKVKSEDDDANEEKETNDNDYAKPKENGVHTPQKKKKTQENGISMSEKTQENGISMSEKTQENGISMSAKTQEYGIHTSDKKIVSENSNEDHAGALTKYRISEQTVAKLNDRDITYLFPIQYKSFDHVYDGYDVIGQARTGTGKTLSFALPLVEVLQKDGNSKRKGRTTKVLVMVPTRELAKQVADDFLSISEGLSVYTIYGGTPYGPQVNAIRSGIDVLVGTPGRIFDHIERGNLDFSKLQHVVLDEVDQMLDMGFADMVDSILATAYKEDREGKPQTLLFSATLPPWVYTTAKKYMKEDQIKRITLVGDQETRAATTVQHLAIKCGYFDRAATIGDILQVYSGKNGRAIIFNQTKKDADELAVSASIKQDAHVLHGDIPQEKREMVLKGFKDGKYNVLVTTDVAARGLDIPQVDLVIQCSPPKDVDSYIHRSGRTGRAGRSGVCLCFYKPQEENYLTWVERKARIKFKRIGAPTTEDIIKSSATDAAMSLESVSDDTLKYFRESAEKLIEERGAVDALSAALALISGSTKIVSRSLLSSKEGYTTYLFKTNIELRTTSYAWRALEKQLPMDVKEQVTGMRFCKDKMGCVFDLPSGCDAEVDKKWTDGKFDTLNKATELPELLELTQQRYNGTGRSNFGERGTDRGHGRGRGRGFSRGFGGSPRNSSYGGYNNNSFRGGFKRKQDFSGGASQNKKIKFD